MKTVKIRGWEHRIVEKDGLFQAVMLGHEPAGWDWHVRESAAIAGKRYDIDARLRAYHNYPSTGPGDTSKGELCIHFGMEEYSGWGWEEHTRWVAELSGLDAGELVRHVRSGALLRTDEQCTFVDMHAFNHVNAPYKRISPDRG
jgi:hypothetical protein